VNRHYADGPPTAQRAFCRRRQTRATRAGAYAESSGGV